MRNRIIVLGMMLGLATSPALAGPGDTGVTAPQQKLAMVAGQPITGELRVRMAANARFADTGMADVAGRVQHRIASSMFDYYPQGRADGFHISGGARYYSRLNVFGEGPKLTRDLLWAPNARSSGQRGGFRKFTPAVTMGYTSTIARDVTFGIEAGALAGRATVGTAAMLKHTAIAGRSDDRSGLNPMVNLVLGHRF